MTTSLPQRPDLDQLRRQAKDLLKAQKKGDPEVCSVLRHLHRFSRASDADIISADVKLNEVQFALALEHGFSSWNALKQHIEALPKGPSPDAATGDTSAERQNWRIIEKGEMTLVGMVSYGRDIHELWVEFEGYEKLIKHRAEEGVWYEYHAYGDGWEPANPFYCMAAVEVTQAEDVPDNMFVKQVPAARYVVYSHRFESGGFDAACKTITEWLETGPYEQVRDFDLQLYDSRMKGMEDPESEMDFLIPVEPKSGHGGTP